MKKDLIFHIGLPKTGSTAIQAFLARNMDILHEHGISYPFISEEIASAGGASEGNALHEFVRLTKQDAIALLYEDRAPTFFAKMVETAIEQSEHPTILISGEELSALTLLAHFEELSKHHRVRIIAYVRDPYDIVCSSWKQQVKVSGESRSFAAFVKDMEKFPGRVSINRLAEFVRSGLDVTALSYDSCRSDLIASFLEAIGVRAPLERLSGFVGKTHNPSLSFEEASLVVMAYTCGDLDFAPHLLASFHKRAAPFKDPVIWEVDQQIRTILRDDIETLNALLKPDQRLRVASRKGISLSDLAISHENVGLLLKVLSDAGGKRPASNHPPSQKWLELGLPEDFDPERYLLLNPDVARAGLGAEYHYLNHGRWEGRVYKRAG
jgi:hypothetical protein